jgi:hypothetical protein
MYVGLLADPEQSTQEFSSLYIWETIKIVFFCLENKDAQRFLRLQEPKNLMKK